MNTATINTGPTLQPVAHSSQCMRISNNVLPDERVRELVTQVTQLDMRWVAGDLRVQFAMRASVVRMPLAEASAPKNSRPRRPMRGR